MLKFQPFVGYSKKNQIASVASEQVYQVAVAGLALKTRQQCQYLYHIIPAIIMINFV